MINKYADMVEDFQYLSYVGCALSLLSSRSDSSHSPADFSIRCSAALRELIAENRAALMAKHLVPERELDPYGTWP
ncbi:hypothetical protein Lal_00035290 [Lupinus albus]|nr:hypothetical protein Lal_00035290 [Lupinus albus]